MIEQKALAYANMYGVFGTLHKLCELDGNAKEILQKIKKPISVCFDVKNGPCRTFRFDKNGCTITEGSDKADCKMNFSSPEKFNLLINEGKPGVPVKGTVKLLMFLTGTFTELTNRLIELLRPSEENLKDRAFFEESTLLTMYTVAGAISGLANSDSIAMISAGNTADGDVSLGVKDKAQVTIRIKNHRFETLYEEAKNPRAIMEFADIDLAYGLFNGTVSTINEMCKGNIRLAGVLSMVDNINRILDRVSLYLS
ncbi:MAG: hypothetical protein UHO61_00455 [Acutalibacteraceae bacterium]|nr:hypothetical protein [Acutalibacteraceae bacterium]